MNTLIAIAILSILVMFLGIQNKTGWLLPVVIGGLLTALVLAVMQWGLCLRLYHDMLIFDNYAVAFTSLLIVLTMIIFLMSKAFYSRDEHHLADIYAILLFTLAGGIMMTSFGNLAMLFIGIETLSISLYILAGSKKTDIGSNEAAMKYFLMGSFATGFLVFGIALIYGAAGSFNLDAIEAYTRAGKGDLPVMFHAGVLLLTVGLAFKIAAAPFHFWAPDVYEGTPTLITAFMATVVKIAGFAAFYRLFAYHLAGSESMWATTLCVIAALTMILGNLTAVYQTKFKKMLAYSSISHTGYMLLAIVSINDNSAGALLLYSASYGFATMVAFGILIVMVGQTKNDTTEMFNGLARSNPLLAAGITASMLSLTGIPPLAGFMGKYQIFSTAIDSGYAWLVIIALVGSAVSVAYYIRPLVGAFLKEGSGESITIPLLCKVMLIICMLFILLFGIFPGLLSSLPLNPG
jgi:NADH-quinone oxidoreductase subunit N